MDSLNLDTLLAIVTILGSLATAIVTFIGGRNQLKQTNVDVKKAESSIGVEATERFTNVSIAMVESLQGQLRDCLEKKNGLEAQAESISMEKTDLKIRIKTLTFRLRDIMEKHEQTAKAYGVQDCPGIPIVNNMIKEVVDEIDKEIEL